MDRLRQTDQLLDEGIRDLADLKRLSRKPYCVELMRQIIAAADGQNGTSGRRQQPTQPRLQSMAQDAGVDRAVSPTARNGLTEAAIDAMESLGSGFTIGDVVNRMLASGFHFAAKDPKVALASVFKRAVTKKGLLRIVKRGSGNEPNRYDFIKPSTA